VPHNSDGAITFPNLDAQTQGVKIVTTTVLYVDMRRSTELSLKHHPHTVAKLYSAFVRAMTRCADRYKGHVRGIIGDRVMILFDQKDCFQNAVNTAILINSVCKFVVNAHFKYGEVKFGIGIDYGRMLATKTGVRRHGSQQQNYRALVWLGRPANVASKLTDNANKPEEKIEITWVKSAYRGTLLGGGLTYRTLAPYDFVRQFGPLNPLTGTIPHNDPTFHSFTTYNETVTMRPQTPAILMSKRVYDGYKAACPSEPGIVNGWWTLIPHAFPDVPDQVYGGAVEFIDFRN
jgi:adenylate cyclase